MQVSRIPQMHTINQNAHKGLDVFVCVSIFLSVYPAFCNFDFFLPQSHVRKSFGTSSYFIENCVQMQIAVFKYT